MIFFLSLTVYDRLMTNSNRFLRELADNQLCKACGRADNDVAHILHDCKCVQRVWTHLIPRGKNIHSCFSLPFRTDGEDS